MTRAKKTSEEYWWCMTAAGPFTWYRQMQDFGHGLQDLKAVPLKLFIKLWQVNFICFRKLWDAFCHRSKNQRLLRGWQDLAECKNSCSGR